MTGWRLGFGVSLPALVEPVTRLIVNSVSCAVAFSQVAAARRGSVAAGRGHDERVPLPPRGDRRRPEQDPRHQLHDAIRRVDVFPNVKSLEIPAEELEQRLLGGAGVACLIGMVFVSWGDETSACPTANSVANIWRAPSQSRSSRRDFDLPDSQCELGPRFRAIGS